MSRFALIAVIGGGLAACSSDASRLGDPFTNPFSGLMGSEPAATGSLGGESAEADMAPAPAIRTPRVQSQALPAPNLSPRPMAIGPAPAAAASRVASAEAMSATSGAVSGMNPSAAGMNPDAGRAMTPRAASPVPAPKLQFGKPADKAADKLAEKKAAEAAAKAAEAKAAEARREAAAAKIAEAKAAEKAAVAKAAESKKLADVKKAVEAKKAAEAEAKKLEDKKAEGKLADAKKRVRPGQTDKAEAKEAKADTKADTKADAKAEAKRGAEAEAARKAEAEAKLAKADAAKKLAEAKAAEAAAKAAAAKEAKEAKETKQAAAPVKMASADAAVPAPAPAVESAESFRWPAKGRVINGYGSGGNEGINIAVPEGTPVKAAEDGTVAYAGSDVKGYGKLVLVRHNNGYVSAYAHNGELDVRPGEKVKRGQTIAKSGATGNVTSPQLHFEIRKGATPVDPIPHLASN